MEDAKNSKSSSHIFKHWALDHADLSSMPQFKFRVLRSHRTPMDRQLHEAARISTHGKLNSKSEYRQNQIKRLAVHLTAKELKAVENELEKEDAATTSAMKALSNSLKNKASCNVVDNFISTNDSQVSWDESASSFPFTEVAHKCKAPSDSSFVLAKRTKISRKFPRKKACLNTLQQIELPALSDSSDIMGRSSKGNTMNETRNMYERRADYPDGFHSMFVMSTPTAENNTCLSPSTSPSVLQRAPAATPTQYDSISSADSLYLALPL